MTRLRATAATLAALTLAACDKPRADPRLAEVSAPVHLTVRVIDRPREVDCSGELGPDWVKCKLSRSDREGCVYLEAGEAADKPELLPPADARNATRCWALEGRSGVHVLTRAPHRRAKIHLEPPSPGAHEQRVVIDLGEAGHLLFLREGRVFALQTLWSSEAGRRFPAGAEPDWAKVPSMLGVLEVVFFVVSDEELDRLLAETPDGVKVLEAAVHRGLATVFAVEDLDRVLARLPAAARRDVRDALLEHVRANDNASAWDWFAAHPEEQHRDFVDAVTEAATLDVMEPTLMTTLERLAPERLGEVACHALEMAWLDGNEGYADFSQTKVALALIARHKLPCPWVRPLLTLAQCNEALRCDAHPDDGRVAPLCDEAAQARALEQALAPPELDVETPPDDASVAPADGGAPLSVEEQLMLDEQAWGPLLLAAARQQGPLPADFALREARFTYAVRYTVPDAQEDLDPCRSAPEEPSAWACRLPATITRSRRDDCALVIDDAKKTVTLTGRLPPE